MKTPRQAAVRLALLAGVVVVIIVLIVQAIQRPVGGSTTAYRAQFGDVFGLKPNADVRLRGVQIGKVIGIEVSDQGRAIVEFTVRDEYRLRAPDRVAIKFQNLTGQRYMELQRSDEKAPLLDPHELFTHTVDSFDITTLFNGLEPLLRDADPAVYNRLATNVAALIDGTENSVTPVMRDIATLARYAGDRSALMSTILDNLESLSDRLQGRSQNLENILQVFHSIFAPMVARMSELAALVKNGALEMSEVSQLVDSLSQLGLGASDRNDEFTRRVSEVIPDPGTALRTLSVLPGVFAGLNALIPGTDPSRQCSNGTVSLPVTADVLVEGRQLVVCKGGGR
ncbi:MlaD family protein [Nocardia nova]|uniref:MlaD family protein n=1 Tax=Nocardia nova TaxID=37330 RepID=UPI000CE9C176|nr:MlaD family protein [Nocardia nova]PPI99626.1 MCE family protein [Nocardia nova]